MNILYDPVKLSEKTEEIVVKGKMRKYYKRAHCEKWYGGIVSSYCCGCNLRCVFCWSGLARDNPDKIGEWYDPAQVFNQLRAVAYRKGYHQLRITGGEPTIGKSHLLGVLELVDQSDLWFILETNGIMIGHDKNYAKQLSEFKNLHVRVSLKATSSEEFKKLTGAIPEGFNLQMEAIKNLLDAQVRFNVAIMASFSSPESLEQLQKTLLALDKSLIDYLEEERVILYPPVLARLKAAGIRT